MSNQNSDVFDHGAGYTPLVERQRRDWLWSHRNADTDDSLALAPLIRSSIDDRLPSATEVLPAITVAGISGLRTKAGNDGSFAAFKAAALKRYP